MSDQQEFYVIFDGPPGPEAGRFVEAETADGTSLRVGTWEQYGDFWRLGPFVEASGQPPKRFPVQKGGTIPWALGIAAHRGYFAKYRYSQHTGQSVEEIARRGGFGIEEMDEFVPGWRDKALEIDSGLVHLHGIRAILADKCGGCKRGLISHTEPKNGTNWTYHVEPATKYVGACQLTVAERGIWKLVLVASAPVIRERQGQSALKSQSRCWENQMPSEPRPSRDQLIWLIERYGYARRDGEHQGGKSADWMVRIEAAIGELEAKRREVDAQKKHYEGKLSDLQARLDSALQACRLLPDMFAEWKSYTLDGYYRSASKIEAQINETLRAILSGPESSPKCKSCEALHKLHDAEKPPLVIDRTNEQMAWRKNVHGAAGGINVEDSTLDERYPDEPCPECRGDGVVTCRALVECPEGHWQLPCEADTRCQSCIHSMPLADTKKDGSDATN